MINEIVKLKEKGLTLQQIAEKMNTSIGKVQYRWNKHRIESQQPEKNESKTVLTSIESAAKKEIQWIMPSEYNEDALFAMVQSPNTIYAYWSISNAKQKMVEHHFRTPWPSLPKRLKVYDVTDIIFHGHNAHRSFEISLPEMTNNWFIQCLESDRSYVIDIGTTTYDGSFFTILRSNPIETSRSEDGGRYQESVIQWKNGTSSEPQWLENFSSYSYYQKIR